MIRGWDGQKLNALVDRTYGERAANATNLEKGTLSWFQMYHSLHIHCNVPNPSFFIVTSVIVLRKNPSLSRIMIIIMIMIHIVSSYVDQPVYSWRSGLLWLEYWKCFHWKKPWITSTFLGWLFQSRLNVPANIEARITLKSPFHPSNCIREGMSVSKLWNHQICHTPLGQRK